MRIAVILDDNRPILQIQFYSKPDCCLCDEAMAALEALRDEFRLEIVQIDISLSPELSERYGQDIPVAELGGRKLFKHRADPALLRRSLRRASGA